MKIEPRRIYVNVGVCLLLLLFGWQLASTVRQESLTWDEGDHIFAGYMSWKTHDFGLNPEHPPLMKLLATALALLVDGIAYAMILFLMSVGLTITLGVMRIANLAHCGFAMIGGYIGFTFVSQ